MSESHSAYSAAGVEFTVYAMRVDDKPKLGTKFIYRDGHVSYVDAKGKMFSTRISRGAWYVGKRWTSGRHLAVVRDAVALGVVPKKDAVERLAKLAAERSKKQDQAYAAADVLRSMNRAGVALTPTQLRDLKRKKSALKQ